MLTEPAADLARVLDRTDLYLFPMITPDAVAHGRCCLPPSGVNFGRELAVSGDRDAAARGLREFLLDLRPEFYLDMHNNTGPHQSDAFRTSSRELMDRFAEVAPDRSRDQKVWALRELTPPEGYLPRVCHERFGTRTIVTEFPWYLRLPEHMRDHGARFLGALLMTAAASSG